MEGMKTAILFFRKLLLYWNTIRHLRLVQIWYRIIPKNCSRRTIQGVSFPVRSMAIQCGWLKPLPSYVDESRVRFLNEEGSIVGSGCWNDPKKEKLWLYNLHYFDDLNAEGGMERKAWHEDLIARWMIENPVGFGIGWEAYPLSRRIVNWIKWIWAGNHLTPEMRISLVQQARILRCKLEYHLLGNHIMTNAKALVFSGLFFEGKEADSWLSKGLDLLCREIPEQILRDGAHFERSPMYHALLLEDLLDCINVFSGHSAVIPVKHLPLINTLPVKVSGMLHWLKTLAHPNGEIAFFNDSALNIAASPNKLATYALKLGIPGFTSDSSAVGSWKFNHCKESGYIRVGSQEAVAILDVGPIGPNYLPGHAHADTFSFELSLYGNRVLVNRGTSCYGNSRERVRQRSTAAHNTVSVDGLDSSEVWGGFRVARRAKILEVEVLEQGDGGLVRSVHDGFSRWLKKRRHERQWIFSPGKLKLIDRVLGCHQIAVSYLHLHPQIHVERIDGTVVELKLPGGKSARLSCSGGLPEVVEDSYHPEFGLNVSSRCIVTRFSDILEMEMIWSVR